MPVPIMRRYKAELDWTRVASKRVSRLRRSLRGVIG